MRYNINIELRKNKKTKEKEEIKMIKRTVMDIRRNQVMDETTAEDAYELFDKLVAKADFNLLNALRDNDYADWQEADDVDDEYEANKELVASERQTNRAALIEDLEYVAQGDEGNFKITVED